MARASYTGSKPSNADGTSKAFVDGSPADPTSNQGGPKGAKVIGSGSNASSGKLKTYKTSVASLNRGPVLQGGDSSTGL